MAKALYRQYRPKTFDEVLGQDRVVNVLKNQIMTGKISHAYLFAGERGCGKTTCAKIFAKAINCQNPQDGSPCLACPSCQEISSEVNMDIVEMDAASNRKIDDVRAIKEAVVYPPTSLKYRVYIIDEAHMMTKEAFNALLKIMEEPPSHLVFILATTELDKIPKTILSRVQLFEFNKIEETFIRQEIDKILNDLEISMEDGAKDLIISNAQGAMRDALTILDKVLSFEKSSYSLSDVEDILGDIKTTDLYELVDDILDLKQKEALDLIFKLRENNKSNSLIIDSLLKLLRDILIYKESQDEKYLFSETNLPYIREVEGKISEKRLLSSIEILSDYKEKMRYSDNENIILELAILRLMNPPVDEKIGEESLVDLVGKIVDEKLRTISKNGLSQGPSDLSRDIKKDVDKKIKPPIKKIEGKESQGEVTSGSLEKKEDLKDNNHSLSIDRDIFKESLIKRCGGILSPLFESGGIDYRIDGEILSIFVNDRLYFPFISKNQEILGEDFEKVLGFKPTVSVRFSDEQEEQVNNSEEKKSSSSKDRLREIFGEDLEVK